MRNKHRQPVFRQLSMALLLICALLAISDAQAQTIAASSWEKVSPGSEQFTVLMPQLPIVATKKKQYDGLTLDARIYTVTTLQKATLSVWSLTGLNHADPTVEERENYLDACVELVWDEVVRPGLEKVNREKSVPYWMYYKSDLQLAQTFTGREYQLVLGDKRGVAHIYYIGPKVYVVMGLNVIPDDLKEVWQFLDSFTVTAPPPAQFVEGRVVSQLDSPPAQPEVFMPRQTTQKARILSRPEPQYTEAARKFGVTGTVVLKGVLSSDGQVTNLRAVLRLPHGLTRASIKAAQQIKFEPAMKDGRAVSQYIQIEYNYNLY